MPSRPRCARRSTATGLVPARAVRFSVTSRGEAKPFHGAIAQSPRRSLLRRRPAADRSAADPTAHPLQRRDARGPRMLQKYQQAVRLMMAEPAGSPRSWLFQWYTTRSATTAARPPRSTASTERRVGEPHAGDCDVGYLPGASSGQQRALLPAVASHVCRLLRAHLPPRVERRQLHAALLELFAQRSARPSGGVPRPRQSAVPPRPQPGDQQWGADG